MIWKNTIERYGAVHKTLHWIIALCVLMMLTMGIFMEDIPDKADRFWVYGIHKSLGITILFLMLARLGWKLANGHTPLPVPSHKKWERMAASIVHWGFYALLIAMPLSGWLGTGAANSTINWFGFFPVPNLVSANPPLKELFFEAHEVMATLLWIILGLHVAGALKHAVIDKDGTLRRMLPFTAPLLIFALLPCMALAKDKDDAPQVWTIDRQHSTLSFEATQEGSGFKGSFKNFDGMIMLDPEHPETGNAAITIDLGSIDTQNSERDMTVRQADWFDVTAYPTATYKISKFEKSGKNEGELLAVGTLAMRGLEKPLDLPFTLSVTEKDGLKTAHAVGHTSLKRLDFGVGSGQWADEAMVGNAIVIHVDLTMLAAKPK